MVTTRNSQPLAAAEPETPDQLEWLSDKHVGVNDALEILGKKADITFPLRDEKESPAKRIKSPTHEIKNLFSALFYNDRDVLVQKVETFFDWRALWTNQQDEKIKLLYDVLSTAWADVKSVKSSRANGVTPGKHASSPPRSPTMSVKHAPSAQMEAVDEIQLPSAPKVASNATSNNTSFANTSFWSEAQKRSQDPPSPATTIEDSFHSTQDYGSWLSEGAVSNFSAVSAKLKAASYTHGPMQLDGANDVAAPTQDTYYGSFPRLSQVDTAARAQQNNVLTYGLQPVGVEISSDAITANSSGTPKSKRSITEALESSATTVDKFSDAAASKPAKVSPSKSPGKIAENLRVRSIAEDGLINTYLPPSIQPLSIERRSAFYLVVQDCGIDADELAQQWKKPWTFPSLYNIARRLDPNFKPFGKGSYTSRCLRANIRFSDSPGGRLIILQHLRAQDQLPNLFERLFGGHRLLTLEVDSLQPPKHLGMSDQSDHIQRRFQEMLAVPQKFLGRTWVQFHAVEKKSRRKAGEERVKPGTMQYTFLATEGVDLSPLHLYTALNQVLPFGINKDMSSCKLYARLDLAMSRTHDIPMAGSEIGFVDDIPPTKDPEDTSFNDPGLTFTPYKLSRKTIMNDGCCKAKSVVFHWIQRELNLPYTPTAAQVRYAGAKGMIYLERPDQQSYGGTTLSRAETAIQPSPLIYMNQSMCKVKLPDEYFRSTSLGNLLLSMRVNAVPHPLKASYLYSDFIPILVDRGVPTSVVESLAKLPMESDMEELFDAVTSGERLRNWLHIHFGTLMNRQRESNIDTTAAGFPSGDPERITAMLDSGFEPTKSAIMADFIQSIANKFFNERRKGYKIPLEKSTMAFVIAESEKKDERVLKPGEIQVNFSRGFEDPISGSLMFHLSGPVLIARHPAGRRSDIRKVTAVYRPELSHHKDVAIFPTTGPRPLADQSSGGDYDGDEFWICWEPSLVEPFLNAPVPSSLPTPEDLGMKVDNRPTRDVISETPSEEQARDFVRMGTLNRMRQGGLLGMISNALKAQAHADNSIASPKVEAYADLKDRYIDADKNGYIFTKKDFAEFKKRNGMADLLPPAFTEFTKDDKDDDSTKEYAKVNPDNVQDRIFCILLPRILDQATDELKAKLADTVEYDESLSKEYRSRLEEAKEGSLIHVELHRLERKVAEIKAEWDKQSSLYHRFKKSKNPIQWNSIIERCRSLLEAIQPLHPEDPVMKEWTRECGAFPTTWQLIKASAIATFHYKCKMWFNVASKELCWLKGRESGNLRTMLLQEFWLYKPKKPKGELEDSAPDDEEPERSENENGMEE